MQEVLDFLNSKVREEHGQLLTIDSLWYDSQIDSFGTTVVFLEMDEKYERFDNEWFNSMDAIQWKELTVKSIVERAMNESIKL